MVSNIRVFFIFIVTKIECWPVFKQDPKIGRTVALNNPIAPNAFNRNEETKSSLVKYRIFDVIRINELYV